MNQAFVRAERSSFVGRRDELLEIMRRLGGDRLVTLVGPGGAGKTRLALRAANRVERSFEQVQFLDLSPLTTTQGLSDGLAAAFGVEERGDVPTVTAVGRAAGERRTLLVLDNCEHLLDECAELVDTLLDASAAIHVLATSREPLGLRGEVLVRVGALRLPPDGAEMRAESLDLYEATALFVARMAGHNGARVTDVTAPLVAEVCRRLDGMPLAIELAARCADVLSLPEIVSRLDDPLGLPPLRERAAPERHRSLRTTIDWSARLATEDERRLWARLSLLPGTFHLTAAEEVGADGAHIDRATVLPLLQSLVHRSILQRTPGAGPAEFRLLDTLRAYGLEMLVASGEEPATRDRLHRWIAGLAADFSRRWWGPDQVELLDGMSANQEIVAADVEHCLATAADGEPTLGVICDLWQFWETRGHLRRVRQWMTELLDRVTRPSPLRVRGLWVAAYFARNQGEGAAARVLAEESAATARAVDDENGLAYATYLQAVVLSDEVAWDRARSTLLQALDLFARTSDPQGEARVHHLLSLVETYSGTQEEAEARTSRVLALSAAAGDLWERAHALNMVGTYALDRGDLPAAEEAMHECLSLRLKLGHRFGVLLVLETLTWSAAEGGRAERAARLLGIVDTLGALLQSDRPGHTRARHTRALGLVEQAIGSHRLEVLRDEGRAMDYDGAVQYALESDPRPPVSQQPRPQARPLLSRREEEVAALVTEGLSNAQIALRLHISERTADTHVQNILVKLGARRRAQIAAWVAEQNRS